MEIAIILIIIVIIVAGFAMAKPDNKAESKTKIEEEVTPKLTIGKGFVPTENEVQIENEHIITKFYAYKPDHKIWICPNCEAENALSEKICSVCQRNANN